ncbi:MAG TPA: hypothetical protein VLM38_07930 [Blastocatellia bacterium]|nr:hypothetical protein [Blastocatellia bacterium]
MTFIVMEFVEGQTLGGLEKPCPLDELLSIASQSAKALAASHCYSSSTFRRSFRVSEPTLDWQTCYGGWDCRGNYRYGTAAAD